MQRAEYLDHFDRETEALVVAAEGKLQHEVPTCPGWKVADLARHVWGVINFWPHVLLHNVQDPNQIPPLRPEPKPTELLTALRSDKDAAINLMRHSNWNSPLWNWSNNKTVSFVPRRLANEVSIHRWDAENAGGNAAPIPVELAQDGLDEFVDVFIDAGWTTFKGGKPFSGELIRFQQADGNRHWTIELKGRSASAAWGSGTPDVTVSGTASDLVLLIWRRIGTGSVEIEGDRKPLDRFLAYQEPPDD